MYLTQIVCRKCREGIHDIYTREKGMPTMDTVFDFIRPCTGQPDTEALGVFSPVTSIPEGATVANRLRR